MAEKKSRQAIWRTSFAVKTAEMIYHGYKVLDGHTDAAEILAAVLNVLKWPASFVGDVYLSWGGRTERVKEQKLVYCDTEPKHRERE